MINIKEILEDLLALGYDDDTAILLAKQEFKRRQKELTKSNLAAKKKRTDRPKTNGLGYKESLSLT